jgi:hypothetical protein
VSSIPAFHSFPLRQRRKRFCAAFLAGDRRTKPEESAQVEVGIKQSFLDGKPKSSAAFYRSKENIAIPDDNGITQQTEISVPADLNLNFPAIRLLRGKRWLPMPSMIRTHQFL